MGRSSWVLRGSRDATTQAPLEKGRRQLHTAQATERKGHGGESSHCVLSRVGAGSCSSRTLCSAQAPTQAQEALFGGWGWLFLALLELRMLSSGDSQGLQSSLPSIRQCSSPWSQCCHQSSQNHEQTESGLKFCPCWGCPPYSVETGSESCLWIWASFGISQNKAMRDVQSDHHVLSQEPRTGEGTSHLCQEGEP